jgi:hypothetical protein
MKKSFLLLLIVLSACAHRKPVQKPEQFTSEKCEEKFDQALETSSEKALDSVSELFTMNCFHEVISLGKYLRVQNRDKFFALSTEAAELLTPEGTFTEYVLESYERGYLSLLTSMSYLHLKKENEALIELRKSIEEQKAGLYNYGEDPVLNLLYGAMWDRFDSAMARPYWKRLTEDPSIDQSVQKFAQRRIDQIDQHSGRKILWQIDGYGYLPELDWHSDFIKREKGPYKITASTPFPESCQTEQSLLMSTESWVQKISNRYHSNYHPFLYTKSLIRAPVAIGYGIIGVSTGVAIGIGGCGISAKADSGGAELCEASLKVAGAMISATGNLVEYTLKPDLRHWRLLPKAIQLKQASADTLLAESCQTSSAMLRTVKLTPE